MFFHVEVFGHFFFKGIFWESLALLTFTLTPYLFGEDFHVDYVFFQMGGSTT